MKKPIQIASACLLIAILIIGFQSCGTYKTLVLTKWEDLNPHGIVHLKDCPVVCAERTVFFEEHVYDAEAPDCTYCGQNPEVQTASVK